MTQEQANEIFKGDLGRQLNSFFSTSDDRMFVRETEAVDHVKTLGDKNIFEWFEEEPKDITEETKT